MTLFSDIITLLGRRHNYMGHSGRRMGVRVQCGVCTQRREQLHHSRGKAAEDRRRGRGRSQLFQVAGGREIGALRRQHRFPEEKSCGLSIPSPQIVDHLIMFFFTNINKESFGFLLVGHANLFFYYFFFFDIFFEGLNYLCNA